jgi:cell division septum initiation protein DivIVA
VGAHQSAQPPDPADSDSRGLGRAIIGYQREPVDTLLRDVAETIASIETENRALAGRIVELEADLARRRELERLLRTTLISTERAADVVRHRANAEADRVLEDARRLERRLLADALAERERLDVEEGERRARLRTALALLEAISAAPGEEALDEALLEQARLAAE